MKATWADEAVKRLQNGLFAEVRPPGHSMTGLVGEGDLVALKPFMSYELTPGDIVLVRVPGKRYSHIVLHMVLSVGHEQFLIGSHQGRTDGWVKRSAIFGIASSHGINSVEQQAKEQFL